jgi:crotonobetainyl-CoA:carnitine CoA-transferase CaiB-like acyl-CoA transferase
MVPRFDIVIENFRPGVMARFGLDYATLSALNPRLIYCSISGYGQSGPKAHYPAYAPVIHAASGFDHGQSGLSGRRDAPGHQRHLHRRCAGRHPCLRAIQAALYQREKTGQGQHIDVSMLEAMVGMLVYETQAAQFPGDPRRPLYTPLRTSDGFIMVAPTSPRNFEQLSEAVGHPEWQQDRASAPMPTATATGPCCWVWWKNGASISPDRGRGDPVGHGVPCALYRGVEEVLDDPQLAAREAFATFTMARAAIASPTALPHERLAHPCPRSCLAAGRRWRGAAGSGNWVCRTKLGALKASGDLL